MKGVIFTELLEMIEDQFSIETADEIIERADLDSGGSYTSVGTYDHIEMERLVSELSKVSGTSVADLMILFGRHLFSRFHFHYQQFFNDEIYSSFDFFPLVENYIHVEVKKLYPEAELPSFEFEPAPEGQMILIYKSSRHFVDLAEGLIHGCADHFNEKLSIRREDTSAGDQVCMRFNLTLIE